MSEVIEKIVAETLASGVKPITRKFRGVYDGYGETPIAYVSEAEVFTTASGLIKSCESAINDSEIGIKWSVANVKYAFRALAELNETENHPEFLTAFVTKSFLKAAVPELLAAFEENGEEKKERICITFFEGAMTDERVKKGISDVRGLGYKTAIADFGGNRSLAALTASPTDYVFFSPEMTALAGDRNKPGVFNAFASLLRSLRTGIVLTGVETDDTIREAIATECFGVMPAESYRGEFAFPLEGRELDEIKSDGEAVL